MHGAVFPRALYTDRKNVYLRAPTNNERGHGTHQDRLIKKLRLRAIATVDAANVYAEHDYLPADPSPEPPHTMGTFLLT